MGTPLRALMVEDSKDDMLLLLRELRRNDYDVTYLRVESAKDMRAALESQTWDIILSDYSMPHFSAPAALRLMQDMGLDLPFIIISGTIGEEAAVTAMKAGAHDFFSKGHLTRLAPAIEREFHEAEVRKAHREAQVALRESEKRYRSLFENMLNGVAYCKIVYDQGRPRDYTHLHVNRAFETLTGLENVAGKRMSEVIPGICESDPELFEAYARVALSGTPEKFEIFVNALAMWFSISVYSPEPEYFVSVFDVITERKRAEAALRQRTEQLNRLYEAGKRLGHTLNLETVYDTASTAIRGAMQCDRLVISSYSAEENLLRRVYEWQGDAQRDVSQLPPIVLGAEGQEIQADVILAGEVRHLADYQAFMLSGQPVRVGNDTSAGASDGPTPNEHIPGSALMVPMKYEDRGIGVIEVWSHQTDAYFDDDLRFLEALAPQVAAAAMNARLYGDLAAYNASLEQAVAERTAQLNHAKERIEAILNNSNDVMILCRPDGKIDQVNPAFDKFLGYDPNETVGKPVAMLVVPEQVAALRAAFEDTITTQEPQRLEIIAHCKDLSHFDADVVLSPIIETTDHLLGVICSLRDITQRKLMDAQLRQTLEHEMRLSDLKSRYVSMAAHDLRNPLASIQSAVDVIHHYTHKLTEDQKEARFNHIGDNIKLMVAMLDDILTIGRVESGKLAFAPASMDLVAFCEDLIAQTKQATGVNQMIDFSFQGACNYAVLDAKLLHHILGNLLSNAVKYSPDTSTIQLEVMCHPDHVVFKVVDQGIGIPQADQARLFEAFHRASNVGKTPGTGLGLAIVKQSVDLHRGSIQFESEVGTGTTFTITIPFCGDE